uniref:ARD n=1 Tax=Panagrolaimus superbus TaxID=310955 RepID=A0A914YZI7_9BILA
MVQIWKLDNFINGDPRLPHHCFPPKKYTPDELTKKTGALYFKLDLDDPLSASKRIAVLKLDRNLKKEDTYTLDAQSTLDFEEKLLELFEEIEGDEQARLVTEGAAYYDVEGFDGSWVRILCEYGDLLIIPKGRPHRMTTTSKNFVKVRRFYKGDEEE